MKTQLDLYRSAMAAATATLDNDDSFAVESGALEAFKGDKQSPDDWEVWKGMFVSARNQLRVWAKQKAPSQAKAEAAAEAKKAAKTEKPAS